MPTPKDDESQDEFIRRCVPAVLGDGTTNDPDQAVAICHSIWNNRDKELEEQILKKLEIFNKLF